MRNYLYSHINNYVRSTFVRWACTSNLLYDLDGIFSRMCGASARFYPFSSQMRMVFAMTNYSILLYLTTFEPESINIHSNYHFHIHANAKSVHTFAHLPIWAHWITCCYWLLVLMVILIFKLPWWMEKKSRFQMVLPKYTCQTHIRTTHIELFALQGYLCDKYGSNQMKVFMQHSVKIDSIILWKKKLTTTKSDQYFYVLHPVPLWTYHKAGGGNVQLL